MAGAGPSQPEVVQNVAERRVEESQQRVYAPSPAGSLTEQGQGDPEGYRRASDLDGQKIERCERAERVDGEGCRGPEQKRRHCERKVAKASLAGQGSHPAYGEPGRDWH